MPELDERVSNSLTWAEVRFIDERTITASELAQGLKWKTAKTTDPNVYRCVPLERYTHAQRPDITGFEVVCSSSQTDIAARISAHFCQSPMASDSIDQGIAVREVLKLLNSSRPNNPLRAASDGLTGLEGQFLVELMPRIIQALCSRGNQGHLVFIKVDQCFFVRNIWIRFMAAYAKEPELFRKLMFGPNGSRPDRAQFRGFEGAEDLYRSKNFEAGTYFALPLLLCAPASLGVMGFRKNGLYVWLEDCPFQSAVVDDYGDGNLSLDWLPINEDPLDLVRESGYFADHEELKWDWAQLPPFSLDLLEWFTDRMDHFFSYLGNPCHFVDRDGKHEPVRHFLTQLSIHRLFVVAESILHLHPRAHHERISLLFDGLDILQGLRQGEFDQTLSLPAVEKKLSELLEDVPATVRALFKARFGRVPTALNIVKNGFLDPTRNREPYQLIRQIRNSKHSFVGSGQRGSEDFSLIFEHSCALPPELAEVVVVHLLWLISDPQRLRLHYPTKKKAAAVR